MSCNNCAYFLYCEDHRDDCIAGAEKEINKEYDLLSPIVCLKECADFVRLPTIDRTKDTIITIPKMGSGKTGHIINGNQVFVSYDNIGDIEIIDADEGVQRITITFTFYPKGR